jgi:DNA repair exonuclease SbcCD ATPase subunit
MTQKTLKEYGLEFINEMAKDREVAQQEIGVVVSGTKSTLTSQGSPHFTYQDIDKLVKTLRKETSRIVDSELTRITIKSLGRIKEAIASSGFILTEEVSSDKEEDIEELQVKLLDLRSQIKEKNVELQKAETDKTQALSQLTAKTDELSEVEAETKRLRSQNENQQQEIEIHQKQVEELVRELQMKQSIIEKLKEQELIHEKDIEDAIASFAETYQIQDNYYQRMLEEGIQRGVKEIRQELELDLEEVNHKFNTLKERSEDAEKQHKLAIERLEEALQITEEQVKESQEKLAQAHSERMESNILRDYTERLLSTHPLYASILILLNLGGVLDLPTLAMSVGAHPLKLKQMLGELVTKGLITLSTDDPPMVTAVMSQM